MKRLLILCLCLFLLWGMIPCASAYNPKIVDEADVLTDSQIDRLEQKAQKLADKYDIDVVIVTVWSLGSKSAQAYADDYFDYNGYGIGRNYSGCLFLLSISDRQWHISTHGDGIAAITDYGRNVLFNACKSYLSDDEYYDAFDAYLDQLSEHFEAYADGNPIDVNNKLKPSIGQIVRMLIISLVIGLAIAGVSIMIMRGSMNTFKPQRSASNYIPDGGFRLVQNRDVFLYSNVTKTRRDTDNGSGGGSRGGSSVHRSSSGRSHGGGGGRF